MNMAIVQYRGAVLQNSRKSQASYLNCGSYHTALINNSKAPGNTRSSLAIRHRRPSTTIAGILAVYNFKPAFQSRS